MMKRLIWMTCLILSPWGMAVQAKDDLAKAFASPPAEARPWVYCLALSGNLTKEGITADFEAMARVGIGGLILMDVDQGVPPGKAAFAGPLWMDVFSHACREADRLGLEITMNNDAGWCGSGGPWITPELSMQKVVWKETVIEGGQKWKVSLPQPEAVKDFYRDIAVLAMPAPEGNERIGNAGNKALFAPGHLPPLPASFRELPANSVIPRDKIVDLTGKDQWDVPAGKWLVMRFGHTTTGKDNHPAPESGRGLECDKFSREAIGVHYKNFIGRLVEKNKALTGKNKALVSTHIDSWEIGSQNWTAKMREEFKQRRKYDLLHFLPAYAGYVIDSEEVTERFLWDLRQTVSDLIVENYAAELKKLANADGLRLSIEGYSWDNNVPVDESAYNGQADEPIAEFWAWPCGGFPRVYTANSCPGTASAAHTYGRRIIGAEAFTSSDQEKWQSHPATIKTMNDWAFAEGINRIVFHRYAVQPWVKGVEPGMAMGPWGLHYERTQTWWEMTKPWHDYLARSQHLLRQGLFVADILYLQPEGSPRRFDRPPETELATDIRNGYNFDGCSPDVILNRVKVKDGRLVLPDGMNYRVLVLPDSQTMTLKLLKKIKELSDAGATIIANPNPPVKSPSLADMEKDAEVKQIASELWPKLVTDKKAAQYLKEKGVPQDFTATAKLRYIHRATDGADIYFVANPDTTPVQTTASFRMTGKQPELWHPETGNIEPIRVFSESDGCTHIPLVLGPAESVFVVFKDGPDKDSDRIVSLKRDGQEMLGASASGGTEAKASTPNTFTMAAWIKPNAEVALPTEAATGITAAHIERNDVVYAAPGHEVWKGNAVGAGFGAGKNGVGIYEHGDYHFAPVLVHPAAISDWTHVAVVYQDGTPSLYLNGKLAKKGQKSGRPVHSGVGAAHGREIKAFAGESAAVTQFPTALSADEIKELAAKKPSAAKPASNTPIDPVTLEAFSDGTYEIRNAAGKMTKMEVKGLPAPLSIEGAWNVTFAPGRGAPEKTVMDKLASWSTHQDDGIKHFSGSAVYRKKFDYASTLATPLKKSARIYLDLGKVEVMASVKVNGKDVGIAWKTPYRLDITDAIKEGANTLEIQVANLWINRMIGDESLPEDSPRQPDGTLKEWPAWLNEGKSSPTGRHTFTTWRLWKKGDALADSGLLGPVVIQTGICLGN